MITVVWPALPKPFHRGDLLEAAVNFTHRELCLQTELN